MIRALFLFFLVGSAFAQSTDRISAAEFGRLWGPALDPAGATQVRNYPVGPAYPVTSTPSVTAESGGGLAVSKSARFPIDPSRVIDVTAKAPISKAAMGKAFKLAVAASGGYLGLGLFAAAEIADWMNSAHMRQNPANPADIQINDPAVCSYAPCANYWVYNWTTWIASTPGAACNLAAVNNLGAGAYGALQSNNTFCYMYRADGSYWNGYGINSSSTSPKPPAWITPSPAQLETAASFPTMKPEWLTRILDSGVPVDAGAPSLTGPSSVAGPSSSSTKQLKDSSGNVTGTQTVNQSTTYNITYNGNTYNVNSVTTTTTVNPDGTTSVDTKSEAKPQDSSAADTPFTSIPTLYTKKYPNGLEGVWAEKKAQLTSSPLLSLVGGLMPSVGSSGSCPSMVIPLDVGIANFGSHDFAPPCWVWDFGRVVIIVSALLLGRRLIFGG